MSTSLKSRVLHGLFWSMAQSWGGRAISFLLFLLLARLLSPSEFGLVASATVVLAFMEVLYEQGFGDALVQKQELLQQDLNAVFFTSLASSLLLAGLLCAASGRIAALMGTPGLGPVLMVTSLGLPIAALGICQQALYRKKLEYKWLAVRTIVATTLSGVVGVGCALQGFGAWSLVAQGLCATSLNSAILWSRPLFRPGSDIDWSRFRGVLRYSVHVLGNRLVDFANTRLIELLIAIRYGAAALGVYVVGSRIYQTAMQLLSSVVLDVAHSGFSQISNEPERLLRAYYKSLEFTAAVALPCFIVLAALSPQLVDLCFGRQWGEAAGVMHYLCLLGALQCVQFYNATTLNAIGRPELTLRINLAKMILTVSVLGLSDAKGITGLTAAYAASVALVAPLSFGLACRHAGVSLLRILSIVWPFLCAALCSYAAVALLGARGTTASFAPLARLAADLAAAALTYLLGCALLAPVRSKNLLLFFLETVKERRRKKVEVDYAVDN
ncbi:MAG: hypothetical protein A2075_02705 [Geobacteraceae bacterium GWC2_58_44]|nr:MAG: hypothetical protein A2075_02705 [Geobacteraceae bacterium GWC2_58_44]